MAPAVLPNRDTDRLHLIVTRQDREGQDRDKPWRFQGKVPEGSQQNSELLAMGR